MEDIYGNNSMDQSELKVNATSPQPTAGNCGMILSEVNRVQTIVQDLIKTEQDPTATGERLDLAKKTEALHLHDLGSMNLGDSHPNRK